MPFLAYALALLIAAGTFALSVELVTKPDTPPGQTVAAVNAKNVRQIPITKQAAADAPAAKSDPADRGDPNNALSPVYPAQPGKNLPPVDQAVVQPAINAPKVETTGVATRDEQAVAPTTARTATVNACAVAACSSAYRSFRVSDCSYQPNSGARKTCDMSDNGARAASAVSPQLNRAQPQEMRARTAPRYRDNDLAEAERVVRNLPGPMRDRFGRRVVVMERPDYGAPAYAPMRGRRLYIDDEY